MSEQKPFSLEKTVYYHDTDAGGVVYYGSYLRHLEEARTEFFHSRQINLKQLANQDIYFVVARIEIDFKSPAFYLDRLRITAEIKEMRRTSMVCLQEITRENQLILQAKVLLVCISGNFRPRAIPDQIRQSLAT
ncbi:MAG: YbgC/FadM family acyl-CoA thioesterase [Candidatus Omnitrophica bacterium]|nr:YbgC/FadM family acyl-CoA thioesterase [Candidatus Omnitrophota bacterium]